MKPLPNHLPPVPEGYVYLGIGGEFNTPPADNWGFIGKAYALSNDGIKRGWRFYKETVGKNEWYHYAFPIGSPTHILNSGNPRYINHHKKQNDRHATS